MIKVALHKSIGFVLAACVLLAGGCDHAPKAVESFEVGPAVATPGALPGYPQILTMYNERVAKLTTLWARADLKVEYVNSKGEKQTDSAEATLQYALPRNFSFIISKVGEHYYTLGSDENQYWWIDRKSEPPTVVLGRHDLATRKKAATLDLPVLPLEIVDCLAVTPLPNLKTPPVVSWSPLQQWIVFRIPSSDRSIEYWIDPKTYDPGRIRLFDSAGHETIDCWHKDPASVNVSGRMEPRTRVSTRLKFLVPERDTRVTISLNSMETRPVGISKVFNLPALRMLYRITREIDLDKSVTDSSTPAAVPSSSGAKK